MKRVLVVDDSALMRRVLSDCIHSSGDLEVAGLAIDGQDALEKINQLQPDVVSLDLNMPRMGGLETLRAILKNKPCRIIVVTSEPKDSAAVVESLAAGAIDFVYKGNPAAFAHDYVEKLRLAAMAIPQRLNILSHPPITLGTSSVRKIVVVASSTGGPSTLEAFLLDLPKEFPAPICIVQHMPAGFTKSLAERLNSICNVRVKEAEEGEVLEDGWVYFAPGNYHMELFGDVRNTTIRLNQQPSQQGVRPCANILFKSAVNIYKANTIGIVLTGMGQDGLEGSKAIKDQYGTILSQDKDTSVIYGMPKAVADAGLPDAVVPIGKMSVALGQLIGV